jgi:hypothetical protein
MNLKLLATGAALIGAVGISVWKHFMPSTSVAAGSVAACRASVPVEPLLKPTKIMKGGHVYSADPAQFAYLKEYLARKADQTSGEDKRRVLAFRALQGREGSTAAINTYDNQILTWGTGWSGLGGLPEVMDRLVASSPAVVARLKACGVEYLGHGQWSIVDDSGKVVTGKQEALQVIRKTPALIYLFIDLAKNPATRDAVTDAQLATFMVGSGKIPGSETIATQALFNFVTHLKHWAPSAMRGVVEAAGQAVPGEPSEDRDRLLAPEIVRRFVGQGPSYVKNSSGWKQLQGYALRDMKADGLDVSGDPVITAAEPPGVA